MRPRADRGSATSLAPDRHTSRRGEEVDPSSTAVILEPDRATAWRWTLVGIATIALATWIAVDARTSLLAWGFVALCVVLSSYVVLQLVLPDRFQLRLDAAAIEVRLLWQHRRIPWERVHLARVVTVTGEPVLELHVWGDDPAQGAPRATGVLLPLGADLDVLHEVLERRLGRADLHADADTSRPEPV